MSKTYECFEDWLELAKHQQKARRTMIQRRLTAVLVAGTACLASLGCTDSTPPPTGTIAGPVVIVYQGQRHLALAQDGKFVIGGDVVVPADEVTLDEPTNDGTVSKSTSALTHNAGFNVKWANGIVPYSLASVHDMRGNTSGPDVDAAKAGIRTAISWWASRVPGLTFIEQSGACPSGSPCLNFVAGEAKPNDAATIASTSTDGVGTGSPRTANVGDGLASHAAVTAHEIGHALGAFHEQERKDRDSAVTIVWKNIWGCLPNATTIAGCGPEVCEGGGGTPRQNAIRNGCCTPNMFTITDPITGVVTVRNDNGTSTLAGGDSVSPCYQHTNFGLALSQGTVYGYDFDSIMEYEASSYPKTPGAITIQTVASLPPGIVLGQRDHLSDLDLASMRALYPVLAINRSLFRNSGLQTLAYLAGREQDINTVFDCGQGSRQTGTRAIKSTSAGQIALPDVSTVTCNVGSPFWELGFDYPNSSQVGGVSPAPVETFHKTVTLVMLNPGLIPVLFTN